ncbi:pantetheine-phosphate adenylyltransferase [Candidatus Uhrbacteria bacterium]|nr:pantetheine-phosphate adenylyltransferase [Candidatus Uhrbacteria bacterium]
MAHTGKAVYAGSFDPPTNGHAWMIARGAALFDALVVAVGVNPAKEPTFSADERLAMLRAIARPYPNVTVVSFTDQYLVRLAEAHDAKYLLRGIRSVNDLEFEQTLCRVNADLAPNIETVFRMPPRELAEISSSFVRGLIGPQGWPEVVERFVPPLVFLRIDQQFGERVDIPKLRTRFEALEHRLHLRPLPESSWFSAFVRTYGERHRWYHTLEHIAECLAVFDIVRDDAEDPDVVELALWYHDAVYRPGPRAEQRNEEQSADLARRAWNGSAGFRQHERLDRLCRHILATADHAPSKDPDTQIVLDCDLAILGADPARFRRYDAAIREEYAHVPEETYRAVRTRVLEGFLAQPTIYGNHTICARFETQADENLTRAIEALRPTE